MATRKATLDSLTAADYVLAFEAITLTNTQREMLLAHLEAPGRIITASQLAKQMGWRNYSSTNLHYGSLGNRLARKLGVDTTYGIDTLAIYPSKEPQSGHTQFTMRPAVAEAIIRLNLSRTFLLVWNPKRSPETGLFDEIDTFLNGSSVKWRWSTGNRRDIQRGERVFGIRLGREPKGIFMSGTVTRESYQAKHWDGLGKANYIEYQIDAAIPFLEERNAPDPDRILPLSLLQPAEVEDFAGTASEWRSATLRSSWMSF